ncbi:MAG TPA: peptidylprolyl isomerase, partial [Myxococcota bacterium]
MKRFVPSLRVSSLLLAIAVVVAATGACKDEATPALPPTIGDKIPAGHGAPSTTNGAPEGTPGADKIGSAPDGMPSPHGSHDSPGMGAPAVESRIAGLDKAAVVAKVDDATITKGDVDRSIVQAAALARIPPEMLDAQTRAAFEQPAYEKLIERTLLAKEAARRGLVPSDADFAKQREQMLKSLPEGKSLDDVLKAVGADQASFDRDVKVDVTIGNLLKKIEGDAKAPDDAAIKAIYEANKEVFTIPGLTSAAHVLIKVDRAAGKAVLDEARAKADAIKKEVTGKDAATFAKVAAEKSDDGSGKARGGDIGTFKRGDLFPEFEEVAFKLKEGEIGGPVLTDRG